MYVGPWGATAPNSYWNAAHFNGAVLPLSELVAADDPTNVALRFLREGRLLLAPVAAR